MRLVGPAGEQVGIVAINDALRLAQEADLDLVEVAPQARPPVCKLMDYGKFKYESALKARESRKNQAQTVIKEIKLRPKIDPHDYGTKKGHVERFLKQGDKVKVTIMFRGREQSRPELGFKLLQRLAGDIEELGFVESSPKQDGRNMIMVLGPHKRKTEAMAAARADRASRASARSADLAEQTDLAEQAEVEQAELAEQAEDAAQPTAAAARPAAAEAAPRTTAPSAAAPRSAAPQVSAPRAAESRAADIAGSGTCRERSCTGGQAVRPGGPVGCGRSAAARGAQAVRAQAGADRVCPARGDAEASGTAPDACDCGPAGSGWQRGPEADRTARQHRSGQARGSQARTGPADGRWPGAVAELGERRQGHLGEGVGRGR